jgi:hypothetical protein
MKSKKGATSEEQNLTDNLIPRGRVALLHLVVQKFKKVLQLYRVSPLSLQPSFFFYTKNTLINTFWFFLCGFPNQFACILFLFFIVLAKFVFFILLAKFVGFLK